MILGLFLFSAWGSNTEQAERPGGPESQPGQRTAPEGPAATPEAGVPGGGTKGREEPVVLLPLLPSKRSRAPPCHRLARESRPFVPGPQEPRDTCHCHCLEPRMATGVPRATRVGSRGLGPSTAPDTGTKQHPCLHTSVYAPTHSLRTPVSSALFYTPVALGEGTWPLTEVCVASLGPGASICGGTTAGGASSCLSH